jgi:hypothetical protein
MTTTSCRHGWGDDSRVTHLRRALCGEDGHRATVFAFALALAFLAVIPAGNLLLFLW